jgi:hypothetical protein
MSADERDDVIARALHEIPVPDHGPGFWRRLDDAITRDIAAGAGDGAEPPAARLDTGELPSVRALAHERSRPPRKAPWLAVAAALLVLAGAVGMVAVAGDGDGDGDDAELADGPETTPEAQEPTTMAEATVASGGASETTLPPTEPIEASPPADTVRQWIDALGDGEPEAAAALLGPRSVSYIQALGGDPAGMMQEYEEGYGGWAASPDVQIASAETVPVDLLGPGTELTIVTVSGTYPGEGASEFRVDVIPVVTDQGEGRIETMAHAPQRENKLVFTVPRSDDAGALSSMSPSDDVNVFVPAEGTVFFRIDGGELFADATSLVGRNAEPFALYNPRDDLAPGAHELVVVAVGTDGTITAYGGTFDVVP